MKPFDMSLVQRGARLRRSPFYEAEQRHGPRGYTVYNHMLFPTHYDDFEAEYRHLLEHVTLWDVAVERCLEVSGRDGFRLAQMMTPRDLSRCGVGQAKYVLICAEDGGILNDPVMTRMSEDRFWFALASSDALFYAKGLAARSGLDVEIREAEAHPLQIQGPKARDVVRALFGEEILGLKYYYFREADIDGIPVIVTRTGWTSEIGYEVYLLDPSRGTELWEKILEAGAPYHIRPTGPSDIRRIEGGIFNWGADMTWEHNPFELGLERLVDFGMQGDCVAMEALRRIRDRGVERRLAGVVLDGEPFPALNFTKWPAHAGSRPVGQVTSAIYSPRLDRNIGYCWLPTPLAVPGATVAVDSEWGRRTATVTTLPFVDPEKRIPVS
ncbi:MAG TPA: glycine cleavage T C-terminal barrel domain-containing protein [Gemmatimonadales bacterium]